MTEYQDPGEIAAILRGARTIAIVGLSADELRASHFVGFYLQRHGYRVVPVNPRETEILGQQSYPSLSAIPGHIDVVDVFRRPEAVPAIAEEAVAVGAGALWLQYGVISPEGAELARRGGLARRDGPLHEGRARALPRPHALARLQHRADHGAASDDHRVDKHRSI